MTQACSISTNKTHRQQSSLPLSIISSKREKSFSHANLISSCAQLDPNISRSEAKLVLRSEQVVWVKPRPGLGLLLKG